MEVVGAVLGEQRNVSPNKGFKMMRKGIDTFNFWRVKLGPHGPLTHLIHGEYGGETGSSNTISSNLNELVV